MKNLRKFLYVTFIYLFSFVIYSDPSFRIDSSSIIGTQSPNNIDIYLGVPFAEPPINQLRWEKTKPKVFNKDKYYAKKFAPACMQGPRIVNWYKGVASGFGGDPEYISMPEISEDCLYLNMWVPKNNDQDSKTPVLVFIHGGSNRAGWSFEPNYIGEELAEEGVIVITVAYRLGVFGFYSHPQLDVSNFAILDLIEALKWIKNNISKVGGDPSNITISGESAGATNVAHLITSPLSKNLFQRAIHQSAGWSVLDNDIINSNDHIKLSNLLSEELLGVNNDTAQVKDLKKIDANDLLNAAEKIYGYTGYYPIVDNYSILEPIYDSFKSGNFNHVDLIIGSNADEEKMYLEKDYFLDDFYNERESWGFYSDTDDIDSILLNFKGDKEKLNFLLSSRNYVCPSYFIAKSIVERTNKNVWFYSFDKVRDGKKSKEMGAYHGAELPYIFNTHDYWLPTSETDHKITKAIQDFWFNFTKRGNPNSVDDTWIKFQPSLFNVLSFNKDISMKKSTSIDVCKELGFIKYQ